MFLFEQGHIILCGIGSSDVRENPGIIYFLTKVFVDSSEIVPLALFSTWLINPIKISFVKINFIEN